MRCKTCDYPLWDITARQCPECGATFAPGDFDLVPGSVRFCCPRCDQEYFGTGSHGELEPQQFDCVSCGHHVHADAMVIRRLEGVAESKTRLDTMPWFERDERGVVKAWFATIGAAMIRPRSMMRAIPDDTPVGRAWAFMYLSNLLFVVVGQVIPAACILGGLWIFGRNSNLMPAMPMRMIAIQTVPQVVVALLGFAFLPFMWAALTHAMLKVTGGAGAGFRRTIHALFYSAPAGAISAIPTGCDDVGRIWWVVSAVLMVQEGHGCHGGRATLAVLTGVIVSAIVFVGATALAVFGTIGLGGTGFILQDETRVVTSAVIEYAGGNEGAGPPHAVLLLADDHLTAGDFVTLDSLTTVDGVPLADTTLQDWQFLPENRRRLALQTVADALPRGIVAHRVGDYVFVHHEIDLTSADPGLWIVIGCPDPEANPMLTAATRIHLGHADGRVRSTQLGALPAALAEQNELRRAAGLAPLPDPTTIRHGNPVTGAANATDDDATPE